MIISSVAYVIHKFIEDLETKNINISGSIYDPELDYETSVKLLRAARKKNIKADGKDSPLFSYNRSVLRNDDVGPKGAVGAYELVGGDGNTPTAQMYTIFKGLFDLSFVYYSSDIRDIESFEILYLTRQLTNALTVTYEDDEIGAIKYGINWNTELESFEVTHSDNFYFALRGSVTIDGMFVAFDETATNLPLIKTIEKTIEVVYNLEARLEELGYE